MHKLTEQDLLSIVGVANAGYTVENARMKGGEFTDSDHYGIALAKSQSGRYATWQFHFEDGEPDFYWGHYFLSREVAIQDYETRE